MLLSILIQMHIVIYRMSCAKSHSYNVEQYEAEQDPSSDRGRGVADELLETTDNSEQGAAWPA